MPQVNPDAKTCVTCKLFDFTPDPSTKSGFRLNRECTYHGKISTLNGSCQQWTDPRTAKEKLTKKKINLKAFTA